MAWHWDQAVRPWHGACGARLVFVGCPSKRPYHVRQGRRRQPDSRESRERSWVGVWGVRVNRVGGTWRRTEGKELSQLRIRTALFFWLRKREEEKEVE